MKRTSIHVWVSSAALACLTVGSVRADILTFDNTCGDRLWNGCCDCGVNQKCNNWTVPASPAPICPALPSAADDVFVDGDCEVEATKFGYVLNLTQTNGTFTVNGALSIGNLATFAGPVVWNSGEIARAGGAASQQATCNGGLTIQGDDPKTLSFFGGFRLINTGAAAWSGAGDWTFGMIPGGCCPAIFENAAGGTFTVQNNAQIFQTAFGVGVIENSGTITKSSSGLSEWAVNLNSSGLVHVQNGELRLTRAGILGGTWQIEPGAELGIAGNFFQLDPAVVIQGRAVVKQSGTNPGIQVDSDVTIDDLTVAVDGNLGGAGVLRIAGTLTNEGGDPNVHLNILPGGHLQETGIAYFYGRLDIEGTANIPNGATMGCFNQPMTVMPGGVLTIDDGGTVGQTGLGTQPIENHGTIRKPPTAGTATIANAFNWYLNNHTDGVISVEGGVMRCPSRLDCSGTIDIAAGAEFSQESWAAYHVGSTFTGDGFFHINHAGNNFVDSGYELVVPQLRLSGNVNAGDGIGGDGNLAVTHEFDLQGGRIYNPLVTIRAGATMNVAGPDDVGPAFTGGHVTFENLGRTNVVAQSFLFAVFNNRSTGVVDIQNDFEFSRWFGVGPVANQGLLTKSGGVGDSILWATITNTGTIRAASGRMVIQFPVVQNAGLTELAGGSIATFTTTLNGGVLRGVGDLASNVDNVGGTVEPGASPGILNIVPDPNFLNVPIAGNYTQGAGGRLSIEVDGLTAGAQHDQLVVAGTATLGGTLELVQFDNFIPSEGDQITILTASFVTLGFDNVVLTGFPGFVGATAQVVNANSVVVTFSVDADVDGDGVQGPGGSDEDIDDTDPNVCRDTDGDGCDDCTNTGADGSSGDPANDGPDLDGDGLCDAGDPGDGQDDCPDDPAKTSPGICGCGVADTDTDGDGTADCNDGCPDDPAKTAPGACGCGVSDADSDGDTVADCLDDCPGADDLTDANGNGIQDCLEPPPEQQPSPQPACGVCGMGMSGPLVGLSAFWIAYRRTRRRS